MLLAISRLKAGKKSNLIVPFLDFESAEIIKPLLLVDSAVDQKWAKWQLVFMAHVNFLKSRQSQQ